ncbi:response regulator transcription factor [Hyphomicrobium sp.]|jgi:two-component system nitrate/nitrite response regulator NarP|uniref:response regulator transcription factor n=1 Tax=Hyphomicrobium sp. TaxID=82 RepID=UPI002FE08488
MPKEIRRNIAIADKNPVVRTGLVDIITRDGRFTVTATVPNGTALLERMQAHPAEVEIAILGWALPDMTGGDILAELKRRRSPARAIVYTGEPGLDVLRRTIKAGAWGFMSKCDEPEVLMETISSVSHGRVSFPYVDMEAARNDPLDVLTMRERELLAALADGWSNLQIAARIGISRNTVKYHLKNLYDKLDVHNRAMAVALFMTQQSQQRDPR